MAYDEHLGDRIRQILKSKKVEFYDKKMMGGLVFMVDEKMCVAVDKDKKLQQDRLMARIGADYYEEALKTEHAKAMNFTGTPMKGFVFIEPIGMEMDEDLEFWVQKCLDYNPLAKASKKKSKK